MSILSTLIALVMLVLIVAAAVWIGIYVVLPLVLFFMLVSAIMSLFRDFMPAKQRTPNASRLANGDDEHVIDVEYEEIK